MGKLTWLSQNPKVQYRGLELELDLGVPNKPATLKNATMSIYGESLYLDLYFTIGGGGISQLLARQFHPKMQKKCSEGL